MGEIDYGGLAQKVAENHIEILSEIEEAQYEDDPDKELPEDPSFGPYCGCLTCMVREILYIAWPYIQADLLQQLDVVPDKIRAEVEAELAKRGTTVSLTSPPEVGEEPLWFTKPRPMVAQVHDPISPVDGCWVAADAGGWTDKLYATEAEARAAVGMTHDTQEDK